MSHCIKIYQDISLKIHENKFLQSCKVNGRSNTPLRGWFCLNVCTNFVTLITMFLFYDKRLFSKIMKRRYSVKDSKCIKCIKYLL